MVDSNNAALVAQRNKRKRVARMKKFIVSFLAIWIFVSIIAMTILSVRVVMLQKEINLLTKRIAVIETEKVESAKVEAVPETVQQPMVDNQSKDGDEHKVYLTFDDGPSENTDEILDILKQYNVKASFFVVGKDKTAYSEQYKRIVEEGHTLGMHSFSHKYSSIYNSKEDFIEDYNKIHSLILDLTGVDSNFYRFPGGSSNTLCNGSMMDYIDFLNSKDVTYFDWNVASGDANIQAYTCDELVDNVLKDVVQYKTSVVLLHDSADKDATVESLPKMIEALQEIGAQILPIDEDTTVIQHASVVQ